MKPWERLDRTTARGGTVIDLKRRDREYVIFADGRNLMSSRMHGSEEALAALACERARALPRPVVLVGGLGMGFSLRAALDLLPPAATVVVSELLAAVVEWNRGPLGPLAAHPLSDPRVQVEVGDVAAVLRANRSRFDAVMLDVDNGPDALTSPGNEALYGDRGLHAARAALAAQGILAVWSAGNDRAFERRLARAGFRVEVEHVRARLTKGPRHTIFVGYNNG